MRARTIHAIGTIVVLLAIGCDSAESRAKKAAALFSRASADGRAVILSLNPPRTEGYFSPAFYDKRQQEHLVKINLSGNGGDLSKAVLQAFEDEIRFNERYISEMESLLFMMQVVKKDVGNDSTKDLSENERTLTQNTIARIPAKQDEITNAKKILGIFETRRAEIMKILSEKM